MAEDSLIGWTHHTQNWWMGCDKVAPECAKCYIKGVLGKMGLEAFGQLYRTKTVWKNPLKWEAQAAADGFYRRVFTCSLSDFFHADADTWRAEAWFIMKQTPHLVWLILTKRPELIEKRLPADWLLWECERCKFKGERSQMTTYKDYLQCPRCFAVPDTLRIVQNGYPNVWLGVSSGCRKTLNKMDTLRRVPCALRILSASPLLEDISEQVNLDGFGWVITEGESGIGQEYLWKPEGNWREEFHFPGRRTMKLEWAKNLLNKSRSANVPFFFKQITAEKPGQGQGSLGQIIQQYPSAPGPWLAKAVHG